MKVPCIIFLFIVSSSAIAQERLSGHIIPLRHQTVSQFDPDKKICICCTPLGDTSKMPLYIIEGVTQFRGRSEVLNFLNPNNIENVGVYRNDSIINIYGDEANAGVIIIRLKKNVLLLNFVEALNHFNINSIDRNLKVCIAQHYIPHPEKLLFDSSLKYKVEVVTDNYWMYMNEVQTPERYINITTL